MKKPIENLPNKNKSLVFFTHASQGTLGDPSAAAKLIKSIKKELGEHFKISIILIAEDQYKERVSTVFKGLELNILFVSNLELAFQSSDQQNLTNLLQVADGIVFYPTFHQFSSHEIERIFSFSKPAFIITEYDLDPEFRFRQEMMLNFASQQCIVLNTGLLSNHHGVFCTDEINSSHNSQALSQIDDANDVSFQKLLFEEGYHKSHQLFFGYFNQLNLELAGHPVDPLMFIQTALSIVPLEVDTIDFVLPLNLSPENKGDIRTYKTIDEVFLHLKNHPELTTNYEIEFWKKNAVSEMECIKKTGIGNKRIRFINGFPFHPQTIDKLMKASDEIVMVTGDQSLFEAISNEKIFFYQVMWWKGGLWQNIIDTVKREIPDSKLHQFLLMQDRSTDTPLPKIIQFLTEHKTCLHKEIKLLKSYLLNNKNLYKNLPQLLFTSLENPIESKQSQEEICPAPKNSQIQSNSFLKPSSKKPLQDEPDMDNLKLIP